MAQEHHSDSIEFAIALVSVWREWADQFRSDNAQPNGQWDSAHLRTAGKDVARLLWFCRHAVSVARLFTSDASPVANASVLPAVGSGADAEPAGRFLFRKLADDVRAFASSIPQEHQQRALEYVRHVF